LLSGQWRGERLRHRGTDIFKDLLVPKTNASLHVFCHCPVQANVHKTRELGWRFQVKDCFHYDAQPSRTAACGSVAPTSDGISRKWGNFTSHSAMQKSNDSAMQKSLSATSPAETAPKKLHALPRSGYREPLQTKEV